MSSKINIAHAKNFGIPNATDNFYSLLDRLQVHSEWKYPNRKWTIDTYYHIGFAWMGKEDELRLRVLKLEQEMKEKIESENIKP